MSSLSSGDESQENVSNPPIAAYVTFETFEDLLRARKLLKQSKNLAQKEISFNHIDFETSQSWFNNLGKQGKHMPWQSDKSGIVAYFHRFIPRS